jgi:phospholipid/cholesterol/gamma-HCH transport system substrate-binding protein
MSRSTLEFKVGAFVMVCLALIAGLMIEFSRGTTLLRKTRPLHLIAHNAGGLRPSAAVLLSGVQVGTVADISLEPNGTNVNITVQIYAEYTIKADARFVVEQSGFLGDQYIAVYPDANAGQPLAANATANVQEPFNLQEVARAAAGFIKHIDEAATNLNDAINDVRRQVLNQETLTNLAYTVTTLQKVTADAAGAVDSFNGLITSNGASVTEAVSNLEAFSGQLDYFGHSIQGILDTNEPKITSTFDSLQVSTSQLTNILAQAQNGNGLATAILRNEQLASNVANLASNLAVASGNLRSNGLWRFLWVPKPSKPEGKTK